MKPIYQSDVQRLMDKYENEILRIQKELGEEFKKKMAQRTDPIKRALEMLYRENEPIGYECDLEELSRIDQDLGRYDE